MGDYYSLERSVDTMRLEIIREKLANAEATAEDEYRQLCRERPKEYGDKPFCIRENTYKANYYRVLTEDILDILDNDTRARREWEHVFGCETKVPERHFVDWGA